MIVERCFFLSFFFYNHDVRLWETVDWRREHFWSLGNRPKDGPDLYDPCFLLLFDATIILQTFLYDGSISYEWSLL